MRSGGIATAIMLVASVLQPLSTTAQNTGAPVLAISWPSSTNIILRWTNSGPGYVLESLDSLAGATRWQGIAQPPPSAFGAQLVVTQALVVGNAGRFFRLVAKGNPAGLDFLAATQNPDGSWGSGSQTLFRDTETVLETLALLGATGSSSYNAALSALASATPKNNDDASRQALGLAAASLDVSAAAGQLAGVQNAELFDETFTDYPGRGWGLASGFANSTIDSALVLRAMWAAKKTAGFAAISEFLPGSGVSSPHQFMIPSGAFGLQLAIRKLAGTVRFQLQYPDGSAASFDLAGGSTPQFVNFPTTNGVLTLTAQNLGGLVASYTVEAGFTDASGFDTFQITTPLTYLAAAQNSDGGWGIAPGRDSQLMITAETGRAMAAWAAAFTSSQSLAAAKAWLLAHQNGDGGFSSLPGWSNVSETTQAVLAILAIDPTTPLGGAAAFLRNAQGPDGGWAGNPFQTAASLQAMRMPPVVTGIPTQAVVSPYGFAPINLDACVHDPDNTPAQMSWSVTGNSFLSVALSNRVAYISYTPVTNLSTTSERLTFTATDPNGLSSSAEATFTVASNHPPVVSQIPGQSVGAPQLFAPIYLDNYVSDPDEIPNQLTWTVAGSTQLVVSVSNRVATLSYNTNISAAIGESLTFTATDPAGLSASSTASFSAAPDQSPVVSGIPNQTVTAPHSFVSIALDNYVADPDNEDSQLTWQITGSTRLAVTLSNRVALLSYPGNPSTNFSEQLTFTATDPVGKSSFTSAMFVVNSNSPPVVSSIPPQTVRIGSPFAQVLLDNYVSDSSETPAQLTWQITGNTKLTAGITNRIATITYPGNLTSNLAENLTFTATDPYGLAGLVSALFTVTSNRPPVLTTIPAQSIFVPYAFTPITLDNYVSDPDDGATNMTWQASGNTKLIVTLSNRVAFLGYPANTSSNLTEILTFRATDPLGAFATTDVSFTVNSNRAPVVSAIPGQTNLAPVPFATINLDNYVSDPGDSPTQMTWTVTGNVQLNVSINNRVATITYPSNITNSINELLTFKATDALGLFGTNTGRFAVTYIAPDYVISRGGSVTDQRTFTTSTNAWNAYQSIDIIITNNPAPAVTYTDLSSVDHAPNAVQMNYRLNAAADATPGTYPISVEYKIYDGSNNQLGPLTNSYYLFRVKVQ